MELARQPDVSAPDASQEAEVAAPGDAASAGPAPACALLRKRLPELPPKQPEDEYELSEYDGSDEEAENRIDRSKKHVPTWCKEYKKGLTEQADVDPDTIFGCRVPHVDLEDIFRDELYQAMSKSKPKRRHGSSQNWNRDKLTITEIESYKLKLGQQRSWETMVTAF